MVDYIITSFTNNILAITILLVLLCFWKSTKNRPHGKNDLRPLKFADVINLGYDMFLSNPGHMVSRYQNICKKYFSSTSGYSKEPYCLKIFGKSLFMMVFDSETIYNIHKSDAFSDRAPDVISRLYTGGEPGGLVMNNGPGWKELIRYTKKKLTQLGLGKKDEMTSLLSEQLPHLFDRIEREKNASGNKIQIKGLFSLSALNIVMSVIGGWSFSENDPDFIEGYNTTVEATNIPLFTGLCMLFLSKAKGIRELFGYTRLINLRNKAYDLTIKFIDERAATGHYKENPEVFVDYFLQEIEKRKDDDELKNVYSKRQLVFLLQDLNVTGMMSTTDFMESFVMFMCLHPDVQCRIHEEIDTVIGPTSMPLYYDYKSRMQYTMATIYEVHRFINIVPLIPRVTNKDVEIGGHSVKKGTFVVSFVFPLRLGDTFWENPNSFNPGRFLDENGNFSQEKFDRMLFFGGGPRACPGDKIAPVVGFSFSVGLLQKYTVRQACESETLVLREGFAIGNGPKPFHFQVIER